jgi:hypothetical protein
VLRAERHEVELRQLQLPRRLEVFGHERLGAHGREATAGPEPPW